jgi:hypothetical protein
MKLKRLQGGACVALALVNPESNIVRIAHLGDSGILILRNKEVVHRTARLEREIGQPMFMGLSSRENLAAFHFAEFRIQTGDIFVCFSGGFVHNCIDLSHLLACDFKDFSCNQIARYLVNSAVEDMRGNVDVPFVRRLKDSEIDSSHLNNVHGSYEDITVGVVRVQSFTHSHIQNFIIK